MDGAPGTGEAETAGETSLGADCASVVGAEVGSWVEGQGA